MKISNRTIVLWGWAAVFPLAAYFGFGLLWPYALKFAASHNLHPMTAEFCVGSTIVTLAIVTYASAVFSLVGEADKAGAL